MDSTIRISNEGYLEIDNLGIFEKETRSGNYLTFCPVLKLLGYSETSAEDAFEDLKENVSLFFKIHAEEGTLDAALKSIGWEATIISVRPKQDHQSRSQINLRSTLNSHFAPTRSVNIPLETSYC